MLFAMKAKYPKATKKLFKEYGVKGTDKVCDTLAAVNALREELGLAQATPEDTVIETMDEIEAALPDS